MPFLEREQKPPAEVPPEVRAGKRRAEARALGATLIALATIGLVILYVGKFGSAVGVFPSQIWYLILFACLGLFVYWERKHWKRDEAERVARRKRRHPRRIVPRVRSSVASAGSAGSARSALVRSRPHPSRQAVDMWWRQLIVVAIVLAAVAAAVGVFLAH